MENNSLLDVQHLSHMFHLKRKMTVKAIDDVSFQIKKGEIYGLVGESGSGKSTVARCIMNIYKPSEGEIFYKGIPICKNKEFRKNRKMLQMTRQMIFQDSASSLNQKMKVSDIIAEPMRIQHITPPRGSYVKEAAFQMEYVGLENSFLDRYPSELSGGQRQRVAMGRAIVRSPKVFLMDEPLSNLDAKLRGQMRVEISKLHQRLETTIIYVTHDQTEAMTLGTRIVVMKDGVVQQVDSPQNLYDRPCNKFVAGFIGAPQMNMIDAQVAKAGSDITLSFGGHTVALPAAKGKGLEEGGYIGKTVTLGIRPEDLHDEEAFLEANPKSIFQAEIRVYEMLGSEVLLYFDIDDANFTAKVNPRTTARPGDSIKVAMDLDKVHIFDKETEKVIIN